jgi:lipopolysaccharide transport system permease protein
MWHNLGQLFRYRGLIQTLVVRDLKARYRGSMLGFFWSFVNPLMLLGIYTFIFTTFLKTGPDLQPYAAFLFCGLLPWTWFSTALLESAGSLIFNGNLLKKLLFPAEVLPIVSVISSMMHFFFGLPILAGILIYYQVMTHGVAIHLWAGELAWFPVIVLVQLIFTLGLALLLSSLTVHFRDIKDLLGNILTFWYFAKPIIYSYKQFPEYHKYFNANPFAHLAISYQEVLFYPDDAFGHWKWLLAVGFGSVLLFLFGYFVFDRLRDSFAEAV